MDPDLLAAFLAVEDRRFYRHPGVDPRALARAALADLRARRIVAGGSTITMQLARLLRPVRPDLAGEGVAAALGAPARAADSRSRRSSSSTSTGCRWGRAPSASRPRADLYFGAHATELSLGQAALLAGLARAPSGDNPLVSTRGRARAPPRRRARPAGRRRLRHAGHRRAGPRRAAPRSQGAGAFLAPHFTTPRRAVAGPRRGRRARHGRRAHVARSPASAPARDGGAAHRRDARRPRGEPGGGGGARQRQRRDPGVGGLARFLGRHRGTGGHGGVAAPARVGPQAVPLRAGVRPRLHARVDPSRHRARVPDVDRPLPSAKLRPPVPRPRARARGAGELVQPARRESRGPPRRRAACCICCARRASLRSAAAPSTTASASRSATAT